MTPVLRSISFCIVFTAGCGGGMPLLHGAQVLPPFVTRATAGTSTQFVLGEPASAIQAGRAEASLVNPSLPTRERAMAVVAGFAPGTAPVVDMRVGIPGDNEGGITYSGHFLRVDARHAFAWKATALSVGVGAKMLANAPTDEPYPVDVTLSQPVPGFEVPVILGWQSTASVVKMWAGARFSYLTGRGAVSGTPWEFHVLQVGGLVGLGLGFRHLQGVIELDVDYGHLGTRIGESKMNLGGPVITPATGLGYSF